jgi:hypothetical protein
MSSQPIAITVHPDRIEYYDAGQEQQFKDSEIVAVLERKRGGERLGDTVSLEDGVKPPPNGRG